jgi:hypothetical protein
MTGSTHSVVFMIAAAKPTRQTCMKPLSRNALSGATCSAPPVRVMGPLC